MQQRPKGTAQRRFHKQRAKQHARNVILHVWRDPNLPVHKWAENLRKCSCPMCNSGDPHDHRQFKRADAHLAFEVQRLRENHT